MEVYPMKKPASSAVLYHYPCPDGVFAALAAHLYFSATSRPVLFFPNTVYNPIKPEDLPLDKIDEVYLLDFVGPSGFAEKLASLVKSVIILDHHKTALEMFSLSTSIGENVTKIIDIERSGATIAYDYFKGKYMEKGLGCGLVPVDKIEQVDQLYRYVEDIDLWKWALPNSKAFSSGMKDLNIEYDVRANPTLFEQLLALDPQSIISQGMASLSCKQKLINEVLDQSYEIALGTGVYGHCLAVNADSVSELRSELGHQLAQKSRDKKLRSIGAVVYRVPKLESDELLKISLRSMDSEDTTPISQAFGGGGHQHASSFMLSSSEFENWKIPVKACTHS
ncbi:hypothetical protein AQUCO_00201322v1 [Aquilegia coerulea]|uniref:DHHA1 domain-containing protein n=1 Tax=Aquilegia coerulea TaxID=218851 RepID=A0A2G5F7M9_AQUCA|nr:hypothetical protein AQUCO_00201322v1 [Aquilegia coerulea]